ncbi:MAG: hypothetical protein AB7N65_10015 [Vicinamibacterales bacterium]
MAFLLAFTAWRQLLLFLALLLPRTIADASGRLSVVCIAGPVGLLLRGCGVGFGRRILST